MNKEDRIKAIASSEETGEVKSITYKDDTKPYRVKSIDLNILLYNSYNGRIRSSVLSYEQRANRLLNPEDYQDILIIEQFLYDSAFHRNEKTIESLYEKGQQEIGIVTKDGIIIDGNRRALLLNIINRKNGTNIKFKAIVLPDELLNNRESITLLETNYQMGVDSKVDYNPIEKYIRCHELMYEYNMNSQAIADLMAEEVRTIVGWIEIHRLMTEYLEYLNTPKIYTRLEKREGHFVDLKNYLRSYSNMQSNAVNWEYNEKDVLELRNCYFDYIRLGIPVQSARVIAKPSSSNSFFCHSDIWGDFISEHRKIKELIVEENFEELRNRDSQKSNEDIVRWLDSEWKSKIEVELADNLSYHGSLLNDLIESHTPIKILKRILNNLGQIELHKLQETNIDDAKKLLTTISAKVNSLKDNISN